MMKKILAFCVLLILAGCAPTTKEDGSDIQLESFKFLQLNGEPLDLSAYKGKRVFLNIWATWCGPCIQEMPSIAALQSSFPNQEIAFLLASDEDLTLINRFSSRPVAQGLNLVKLDNPEAFGINAIPVTFIFDEQGKLIHSELGARDWSSEDSKKLLLK